MLVFFQLAVTGDVFHYGIDDIDSKSRKIEVKSSRNYSNNQAKSKSHHWLFMASGCTHTHKYIPA